MQEKRFGALVVLLSLVGITLCCISAGPGGDAVADEQSNVFHVDDDQAADDQAADDQAADDESADDWQWEGEGEDEHDEHPHDEHFELELAIAEQSRLIASIDFATEAAKDEVQTAVVAATLLMEHAETSAAIDALTKAIGSSSSLAVKRALKLKLAEAHLEHDEESSAIAVAVELMSGE